MNEDKHAIAVPVGHDDTDTVWDDHFGEAPRFCIYDATGKLLTIRDNPYWQDEHDSHTGPKRMVELLPECGVFIARHMGRAHTILAEKYGVLPVLTRAIHVQEALTAYRQTANRSS